MKNTVIPINIWDDFYDDGYVPDGDNQSTYAYVEEYDELSEEIKKKALESVVIFIDTLDLPGVEYSLDYYNSRDKYPTLDEIHHFERWNINFKHLTHARLETLLEELKKANLSVDDIPLHFYSES